MTLLLMTRHDIPMIKILFLCHGNICRSPMAEYVMKNMICAAGLEDKVSATSRALHTDEIGSGVYPPVRRLLEEAGIDCSSHHAALMKASDYADYDYIIVMDEANVRDVMKLSSGDPGGKVYKLLQFKISDDATESDDFVTISNISHAPDVADPWYTRNFDITWREVNEGCKALLYKIALELSPHTDVPITNEEMREADAYTIGNFVSGEELMRRAGKSIADEIIARGLASKTDIIGIICGKGNNGGDGLVCADYLLNYGYNAQIIKTEDMKDGSDLPDLSHFSLIVDCIFGTGFKGDVREPYKTIIEKINDWRAAKGSRIVVSADINSGLNGNTGDGDAFVISDLTIAIGSYKHGHFLGKSALAMKDKTCVDIGIIAPPHS